MFPVERHDVVNRMYASFFNNKTYFDARVLIVVRHHTRDQIPKPSLILASRSRCSDLSFLDQDTTQWASGRGHYLKVNFLKDQLIDWHSKTNKSTF